MCFGPFAPSKPKVPEAPKPPSEVGANVAAIRDTRERQRAASESGRSATLLTGSQGVQDTQARKKTLLGQ